MDEAAIYNLPQDSLHQIFLCLPLRQIILCRSLSKFFLRLLSSPPFLRSLSLHHPPLPLLALRPPHHRPPSPHPSLLAFDPLLDLWLSLPLSFLPFPSLLPVASSPGLLYFWAHPPSPSPSLLLLACNPFTRQFRALPQLGSAWSRHGTVLVDSNNRVMVLTELAALYYSNSATSSQQQQHWMKFSSNLPSKPRSPIMVSDSVYALCDVGSPWRNQWKLFCCCIDEIGSDNSLRWSRLERQEWRDVFDILKRPRLVRGVGKRVLMVGGLKSSFSLNSPCSTVLILRLDLETLEWDEAARMPVDMFKSFQECSKFKVFGGGDRVCFSAKRLGKLALWDRCGSFGEWRWIDKMPGNGDGLYRGFVFEGKLTALP